jgi:hypothetical protein
VRERLARSWCFRFALYAVGFGAVSSVGGDGGFEWAAIRGVGFATLMVLYQGGEAAWKRRKGNAVPKS